ncbi:hypothetical protein H0H93_008119 [Arthromyces matolae]|nr:hypothetical protein H0H93_008119 [Arthromyces matolae]
MNDDENTPLLASDVVNEHEQRLFSIEAEARRVDLLILDQIRFADIVDGLSFEDHPTEISFVLAVLLYLRSEKCRAVSSNDLYDRWNFHEINIRGVAVLDNTLATIWTSFLAEYRSLRNINTVLWTPMHLQEIGNGPKVRVIDLLSESNSPISLLSHPVIISAIDDAWKHGVDTTEFRSQSLLTRYDALGTPRVIHLIDWLAHVSFVVLVTHYLLYPIELSSLNGRQQYIYGPRESKKQKKGVNIPFGAPSELDDAPLSQENLSSFASSTRSISPTVPPALTSICARVFVANFLDLRQNKEKWDYVSPFLATLPDVLVPKIFGMLRNSYPTYLTREVITTVSIFQSYGGQLSTLCVQYFLRGSTIVLGKDLPAVDKTTILNIPRINSGVRELELIGFDNISDSVFAQLIQHLARLEKVNLRGCTKVASETLRAIAQNAPNVQVLNLSYTSVTPAFMAPVLNRCSHLKVVKVAGIQSWTDTTLSKLFSDLPDELQFAELGTLKIRQTSISEGSLSTILERCPSLQRLDVSFTLIRHLPTLSRSPSLEKLSLTSTAISPNDLIDIVSHLPQLRSLSIGAMGVNRGSRASITNTSAMTMSDDTLMSLTSALEKSSRIENINLVGNAKLGLSAKRSSAISTFIKKVGRRFNIQHQKLNLAGIHALRSSDLVGLLATDEDTVSLLEVLILSNTAIEDEAAIYIAACHALKTLSVAGTKMTGEDSNVYCRHITDCRQNKEFSQ